jgi:hypothetical protein
MKRQGKEEDFTNRAAPQIRGKAITQLDPTGHEST